MYLGRRSLENRFVTMAIPPAKIAAAPTPAIALPIIRAEERVAEAPIMEPTITNQNDLAFLRLLMVYASYLQI